MKNLVLTLSLVPLLVLTSCGKEKKTVIVDEQPVKQYRTERISGPLSEKEVAWENDDLE